MKKKLTRAQQELMVAEQRMLDKWASIPKFARTAPPKTVKPFEATKSHMRAPEQHQSLVTPGGTTALKPSMQYTGGEMIGLATMHKSNTVPVFKVETAIEISQMRRGG